FELYIKLVLAIFEYDAAEIDIVLLNGLPDIAFVHSMELHLLIIRYDSDLGLVVTADIYEGHLLELFESLFDHVFAKQVKIDEVRAVFMPGQHGDVLHGQIAQTVVGKQRSFLYSR